ncbi:MAG: multicopper oxidase family protein [Miltoncostaeaceae bacterium]
MAADRTTSRRRPRLVLATIGGCAVVAGTAAGAAVVAGQQPPPCEACVDFVTDEPLRDPPVMGSRGGELDVVMTPRTRTVLVGGRKVSSQTYAAQFAAPTWKISPGDDLNVLLRNRLPEGYLPQTQDIGPFVQPKGAITNLHVHGLHVSPDSPQDNVFLTIRPGTNYQYRYKIPENHPPGVFWYHPHHHRYVDMQTFAGQAGTIIVRGGLDDIPGIGDLTDRVMVFQNTQVRGSSTGASQGRPPKDRLIIINGQLQPRIDIRPGESQRWRLVNASTERFLKIAPAGGEYFLLARDGVTLQHPQRMSEIFLAPGQRFEVLVRAGAETGDFTLAQQFFQQRPTPFGVQPSVKVATLRVAGPAMRRRPVPSFLGKADDLRGDRVSIAARRRVVFTQNPAKGQFFVNGKLFAHGTGTQPRPMFSPKLNTVEEWLLVNNSPEWHNFHIHIDPYQVVARNGKPVKGQPEWADSIAMPPNSRITIRQRFADFTGRFVFHCHVLVHEDHGMMAEVMVVP